MSDRERELSRPLLRWGSGSFEPLAEDLDDEAKRHLRSVHAKWCRALQEIVQELATDGQESEPMPAEDLLALARERVELSPDELEALQRCGTDPGLPVDAELRVTETRVAEPCAGRLYDEIDVTRQIPDPRTLADVWADLERVRDESDDDVLRADAQQALMAFDVMAEAIAAGDAECAAGVGLEIGRTLERLAVRPHDGAVRAHARSTGPLDAGRRKRAEKGAQRQREMAEFWFDLYSDPTPDIPLDPKTRKPFKGEIDRRTAEEFSVTERAVEGARNKHPPPSEA